VDALRAIVPLAAASLLAAACGSPTAAEPEPASCEDGALAAGMVELGPSGFQLAQRKLVPDGINSYPLLQRVGEDKWDSVRDVLAQARKLGRPFVRTNAFMDGGDNPARLRDDDGSIREPGLRALDALLAEAERMQVRLLLVLGNNWPAGGGAEAVVKAVAPGEDLPKDAFWSEPRALAAQRAMIAAIVGRTNTLTGRAYADDPTVFAWELANEPRCSDEDWCDDDTLPDWAKQMGDAVREAGARQPVAWGGAGYRGQFGEDLEAIARSGAVDVLTLHVYARRLPAGDTGAREALIEDAVRTVSAVMRDRARLAERFGMPLLIEELGYEPPQNAQDRDAERARVLGSLLRVAAELQTPTFPWMIGESDRPDDDGFLIRPEDTATVQALTCGAARQG
jgi:mannan endo-1,4-beta-mannosidase